MLDRPASGAPAGEASPPAPPAVTISAESFPGLCMGISVLTSLSLTKIGMDGLNEDEAALLTNALLRNAEAWDVARLVENPRVAAGLDLGGAFISIMVPRILADLKKRKGPSSATQAAAAAHDDAQPTAA
jgi:hypothetical protein